MESKVETTALTAGEAADNLVQLYKRISLDHELDESVRSDFLRRLTGAAGSAQHTLRTVNPAAAANGGAAVGKTTTTVAVDGSGGGGGGGGHYVSPTHGR